MAGRGDGERGGSIGEGGKVMGSVILGVAIGFLLSGIFWVSWHLAPLGTQRGDYIKPGSNPPPPHGGYQPRPAPPPNPPPRHP